MAEVTMFDGRLTFNAEAFGKYVEQIPRTRLNRFLNSSIVVADSTLAQYFPQQTGSFFQRVPMYGRATATLGNYNGEDDAPTPGTQDTYTRGTIAYGRMFGLTEKDFAWDISSGVPFAQKLAENVVNIEQDDFEDSIFALAKTIFGGDVGFAAGSDEEKFVQSHTWDISGKDGEAAFIGATTLNSAVQKACGDHKQKFSVVFMHSDVATNLENLNLLKYKQGVDANGLQQDTTMATWNGKTVIIDDSMPVESVVVGGTKGVFKITIGTNFANGDTIKIVSDAITKTYVAKTAASAAGEFTIGGNATGSATALKALIAADFPAFTVASSGAAITLTQKQATIGSQPTVTVTGTGAATVAQETAPVEGEVKLKYTTYACGAGMFGYHNIGAKVPFEAERDPKKNGGIDVLWYRFRRVIAPYGWSFVGEKNISSLSPTNEELFNPANWAIIDNGKTGAERKVFPLKTIPICRIVSLG